MLGGTKLTCIETTIWWLHKLNFNRSVFGHGVMLEGSEKALCRIHSKDL